MSTPAKSNTDVLNETPVSTNVNAGEFGKETTAPSSSSSTSTMPSGIPEPQKDGTNTSQNNTKVVDVSNIPTEGYGLKDFEDVLAGKAPEVKTATKVEEVPKTEDKPELEVEETNTPPTETTQKIDTKPTQQKVGTRDYAGFDAQEIETLKHIGNKSFAEIAPKLRLLKNITSEVEKKNAEIAQLKTGKQMLPDNYFEHPQAFILTKDYNDNIGYLNQAAQVQKHWQQQMANIRRGEAWRDIDIDAKTGRFIFGKDRVADADGEAEVMGYIQHAVNQVSEVQRKVMGIEASFKDRHSKAVDVLKKAEKDNFAVYDQPDHPWKPVVEHMMNQIPAEFRSNPMAPILAKAGTAVLQMGKLLREAQAEVIELKKGGSAKVATESKQAQAGPTASSVSANGGSGKQESTVGTDINDFTKAMES